MDNAEGLRPAEAANISRLNERILILGSSGSGKTTFARQLGATLNLEVIHLDSHFWLPGWEPSSPEAWEQKLAALVSREAWVMDGNYPRSLGLRMDRATAVVLLDVPRWVCLYRCIKRLVQNWGRTRVELAPGCREKMDWDFFKWIWSYPEIVRPAILARWENSRPELKRYVLGTGPEIESFLQSTNNISPKND